jgi:hypothetical protein
VIAFAALGGVLVVGIGVVAHGGVAPRVEGQDWGALLQKYRETRGVQYTEALAYATPRLRGDTQQKARDALAQRLSRLKPESLSAYLRDEEAEIRRAAAAACAAKGLRGHIPLLVPLLRDPDAGVARAAHAALKELSGQSLGPDHAAWEAWWKKQPKS